jgi:hypothetical protein
MKWTIGIVFGPNYPLYRNTIIESIKQNFDGDNCQIIEIGKVNSIIPPTFIDDLLINFDDDDKPAWITKKKNLVAQNAKYENLCIMHDYIILNDNWLNGFKDFYDWDVCMNPIYTIDNLRFRDWVTWEPVTFVDYKDQSKTQDMYVSGSYFCVKKQFLLDNPLDETKRWGESEDVEWSLRCRKKWNYKCNSNSSVRLLKWKDRYPI